MSVPISRDMIHFYLLYIIYITLCIQISDKLTEAKAMTA